MPEQLHAFDPQPYVTGKPKPKVRVRAEPVPRQPVIVHTDPWIVIVDTSGPGSYVHRLAWNLAPDWKGQPVLQAICGRYGRLIETEPGVPAHACPTCLMKAGKGMAKEQESG